MYLEMPDEDASEYSLILEGFGSCRSALMTWRFCNRIAVFRSTL